MLCMNGKENVVVIDSQNVHKGTDWDIDYRKLRLWLRNKYHIQRAIMFFGYIETKQGLYTYLQQCGFEIIFRPIETTGTFIKGNVDVDIAVWVLDHINDYNQLYLMTSDGDFYTLVNYIQQKNKLGLIINPHRETCSYLLKRIAGPRIKFLDNLQNKLALK